MSLHDHHVQPATAMSGSGLPWHELALVLMALAAVAALAVALRRGRLGRLANQDRPRRPAPERLVPHPVLAALAGLMVAAAGIHFSVTREHFLEDPVLGWFFLLLSVFQLGYAALIVARPSRWLLGLGLLSNLAVVGLWVVTRTVGIPFGLAGGEVEAVGAADVVSALVEISAVAMAVHAIRRVNLGLRLRLTSAHAGYGLMVLAVAGAAVSGAGH